MYILSIETATRSGSLALLSDDKVLIAQKNDLTASHSSNLLTVTESILKKAQIEKSELGLLAAAVGPGSFTGLRIGLATVKALAKALKIPAVGVSVLDAAVFAAGQTGYNCVVFAAGRGEVFAQNFLIQENQEITQDSAPYSALIEVVIEKNAVQQNVCWIAPEEKLREIKSNQEHNKNQRFAVFPENIADYVGQIAFRKYLDKSYLQSTLSPLYVRSADVG